MTPPFRVEAPWRLDGGASIALSIDEARLLGSRSHRIRFELYPLVAPAHGSRHHGYWDIPLHRLRGPRVDLTFRDGRLVAVPDPYLRLKAVQRGTLDFAGYAMLHVSLWDFGPDPPRRLYVLSSSHMLNPGAGLPLEQLSVPLTQRCNLACPMCMRHNDAAFDAADVSPEVLGAALEAAGRIRSVVLTGIGETLLAQNLEPTIRTFRRRMPAASHVAITTNALLLERDRAAALLDAGLTTLCCSVDGASPETYGLVRPGADFDRVVRNVAAAADCARAAGREDFSLWMNFVMQPENVEEVPSFVRLASSLGVRLVKFSHYRDFTTGEFRLLGQERLLALFDEALREAAARGVAVVLPRTRPIAEHRCEFMQMAFLWLSGDVVPCCRMLQGVSPHPITVFGNVKERPLLDIWRSAAYRDFRSGVLGGRPPEVCAGCSYAHGLLC